MRGIADARSSPWRRSPNGYKETSEQVKKDLPSSAVLNEFSAGFTDAHGRSIAT